MTGRARLCSFLGLVVSPILAACADPTVAGGPAASPTSPDVLAVVSDVVASGPAAPVHRPEDFVESPRNRDPFRSFLGHVPPPVVRGVLGGASIEEIRVIGIVSGVASPTAMLVDSTGDGRAVHRGDYVGRPEVALTAGDEAMPYLLRWRVESVAPDRVVLARENLVADAEGGAGTLRRVISLRPDEPTAS